MELTASISWWRDLKNELPGMLTGSDEYENIQKMKGIIQEKLTLLRPRWNKLIDQLTVT
jgi:hypothetical protein